MHGLEEKKRNYFKLQERQLQEAQSKTKSFKTTNQIEKDAKDAKWTISKVNLQKNNCETLPHFCKLLRKGYKGILNVAQLTL